MQRPARLSTAAALALGLRLDTACAPPPPVAVETEGPVTTPITQPTTPGGTTGSTTDTSEGPSVTSAGAACPAEAPADCSGACVNLDDDPNHCGACGEECPSWWSCVAGVCALDCGPLTECDGSCYDTDINAQHCGACNSPCPNGQICFDGTCLDPCAQSEIICALECVDPVSDPLHCGRCEAECAAPQENGAASCQHSSCQFACAPYHQPAPFMDPVTCSLCSDAELLADAPVHYWRLSEPSGTVAADEIGGLDGTYVDVTLDQEGLLSADDRAIHVGSPIHSHVIVPVIDLPATALTVEIVARIDDPEQPVNSMFSLSMGEGDEANQLVIYHEDGLENPDANGVGLVLGGTWKWTTDRLIDDGEWHHVAITWTSAGDDNLAVYVDGALVDGAPPSFGAGFSVPAGASLTFAQDQDFNGGGFDAIQRLVGALDSIAVFDGALPADRIAAHADAALCDVD